MMAKRLLVPLIIMIGGSACGENSANENSGTTYSAQTDEMTENKVVAPELSQDELVRVCRVGQGFRVGRDPDDMSASAEGDIVRLAYTRDDGKSFRYDCKVEGNVISMRMIDEGGPGTGPGAWSGRGSTTSFKIEGSSITVRDVFSDGSSDEETYDF